MELKKDKYYYPFVVPSGTVIVVNGVTVNIAANTYYAHNDASLNSIYPSFYIALKTALTSTIGSTWVVEAATPSSNDLRGTIKLKRTGGTFSSLNLTSTSGIVKRLLGFGENDTGTLTVVGNELVGEYYSYGYFSPFSLFDGRATIKNSVTTRETAWSSPNPEVATAIVWRERRARVVRYEYVMGCYVYEGRNAIEGLPELANRSLNDRQNTLEGMWLEVGRSMGTIIACYDLDDLDLSITTHSYENLKFADQRITESMENLAKITQIAGDYWEVTLAFVIIGGRYGL